MRIILARDEFDKVYNSINTLFSFKPSIKEVPFKFDCEFKVYKLNEVWGEEQEALINEILVKIINDEMYAIDYYHEYFVFNPSEKIKYSFKFYDSERKVEVYFPTYYPNGDYYFFLTKNFKAGILGHPWRKELYVLGNDLISEFEKHKKLLNLS